MRARLLDMGEVAPVRSQSLLRALTSLADPPGPPVLALLTPSAPLVLVGRDGELGAGEIEACRSARVPALPWPGRGVRRIDRGRLLFYLTADPATVRESGWPVLEADASRMADLAAQACERAGMTSVRVAANEVVSDAGVIGAVEVCSAGRLVATIGDLAVADGRSGPDAPALAEELLSLLEEVLGLSFTPSLPTPEELDAIYLNDELLAREERAGLGLRAAAGPA